MFRSFCAADTKIFAISDLIFSPRPKDEALWNTSLIFFKWALIRSFTIIGFDVEGLGSSGRSFGLMGLEEGGKNKFAVLSKEFSLSNTAKLFCQISPGNPTKQIGLKPNFFARVFISFRVFNVTQAIMV